MSDISLVYQNRLVQFRDIKLGHPSVYENWGWCSLEIKQPSVSELRLVQFRSQVNQVSVLEMGTGAV